MSTTPVKPVDPQSDRGRELAAELTLVLDEIEERIERERARRGTDAA